MAYQLRGIATYPSHSRGKYHHHHHQAPLLPPFMDRPRFGRSQSSSSTGPQRGAHRRSHSETFLTLPDDDDDLLLLDSSDADIPSLADLDFPSFSDESLPPALDGGKKRGGAHLRSLSVDGGLFDSFGFQTEQAEGVGRARQVHDEAESFDPLEFPRKAMAADKLAELALIDPKRAKRILANRQSAARSKERKVRYTSELEKKVQTLQTEATTLSTQVTLLQKDTNDLTVENKELRLRLEAMEQQAHLRDALNDALREEVQRLKIATGEISTVNGNALNFGRQQQSSPYFGHPHQLRGFPTNQTAQLRTSQLSSDGRQIHSAVDSMDFM